MTKWLLVIFMLVLSVAPAVQAATEKNLPPVQHLEDEEDVEISPEEEAISGWMLDFYRNDPATFVPMVKRMAKAGFLPGDPPQMQVPVFLSEVFRKFPDKAAEWCKGLSGLKAGPKRYVAWAVRNAGSPAADECISKSLKMSKKAQKEVMESPLMKLEAITAVSPAVLDMWWAQFFATGSPEPVLRVINQIAPEDPAKKANPLLSSAAEWSTRSIAPWHPIVRETIANREKTATGPLKKALSALLRDISEGSKKTAPDKIKTKGAAEKAV